MTANQQQVFISYQRTDEALARQLREHLIATGVRTWMDQYDIPAGAYWPDAIDEGLAASNVVVGILSPDAVASRNVKNEWDWAIQNGIRLVLFQVAPTMLPHRYVALNLIDASVLEFRLACQVLITALGLAPVAEPSSAASHVTDASLPRPKTRFVGRLDELQALAPLVQREDVRLVTLTGPGGIGKTRLALALAHELNTSFPEGIWFVDLSPITDAALVLPTIARTLDVTPSPGQQPDDAIAAVIDGRQALLLLDNVEQVIDAAPAIGALLDHCPMLTVLATSRIRLQLMGEHEYPLQSLELPTSPDGADIATLGRAEAVQLFLERAQAIQPDFTLTTTNAPVILAICRQLDGLPLAIELATSRLKLLPPDALYQRLGTGLQLLRGGPRDAPVRQQTMRATIGWSYDLLAPDEQRLFRQLSVFVGGWTLEAAERACDQDLDVLDGMTQLLDHSLVRQITPPQPSPGSGQALEPRFRMLETIRAFGLELLEERGELVLAGGRHADYFASLVAHADADLHGPRAKTWLTTLDAEQNNIRAALQLTLETAPDVALRLAGGMGTYWAMRGHLSEGIRWLQSALDRTGAQVDPATRAAGLTAIATLLRELGQNDRAVGLLDEALDIYRTIGDTAGLGEALNLRGWAAEVQGDRERAIAFLEEGVQVAQASGDRRRLALHLSSLGLITSNAGLTEQASAYYREVGATRELANQLGFLGALRLFVDHDHARAEATLLEGLALAHDIEDATMIPFLLWMLARVALEHGDLARSNATFVECIEIERVSLKPTNIAICFEGLARIALLSSRPQRAAQLLGAAEALRERINEPLLPHLRPLVDETVADLRTHVRDADLQAAWSAGRALSPDQAIGLAIEPEPAPVAAVAPQATAGSLSKREIDVVRLLVDGKSNQEIGTALFISPHTAATHVQHILNKLGVDSRAAAAAYAVRHALVD